MVQHRVLETVPETVPAPRRALALHSALLLALLAVSALSPRPASAGNGDDESPIRLTDVTREAGIEFIQVTGRADRKYFPETVGAGAVWFDADGDGWADLYFVNGSSLPGYVVDASPVNALYRNNGDGTFTEIAALAGVADTGYGTGAAAADYDLDGDVDLYICNMGRNTLYRNRGDGTFEDVTEAAGVGDPLYSASCAFADFNNDGFPDLYVANYIQWYPGSDPVCHRTSDGEPIRVLCAPQQYNGLPDTLYLNQGDGTFTDHSIAAGIRGRQEAGLAVTCSDIDLDGDIDIYVANDADPNLLWINQGDATFIDDALLAGVALSEAGSPESGMGVAIGDVDHDGRWDIGVTNFQNQLTALYRGSDGGYFEHVSKQVGMRDTLQRLSWGIVMVDLNLDSWLDIVTASGSIYDNIALFEPTVDFPQRDSVFLNRGAGLFEDISASAGPYFTEKHVTRGIAICDYDQDGDPDLAINGCDGPAFLLRNDSPRTGNWIGLDLPLGSVARIVTDTTQMVEIRAGESFASCHDRRTIVGIAGHDSARVTVQLPRGTEPLTETVAAGQWLSRATEAPAR